jgi:hypothetical protein
MVCSTVDVVRAPSRPNREISTNRPGEMDSTP